MIVRLIELKPKIFNCKNIQQRAGVTIRKTALQKKTTKRQKDRGILQVDVQAPQSGCSVPNLGAQLLTILKKTLTELSTVIMQCGVRYDNLLTMKLVCCTKFYQSINHRQLFHKVSFKFIVTLAYTVLTGFSSPKMHQIQNFPGLGPESRCGAFLTV